MKNIFLFLLVVFCLTTPASGQIISSSGVIKNSSFITSGDIRIYWSAASDWYGYFYCLSGTQFAEVADSTYWSDIYQTHNGVRKIWDVKDADDFTYSAPENIPEADYGVIRFADPTDNANYGYRGVLLFRQQVGEQVYYGGIEPIDVYTVDEEKFLSYNIWYDDSGASDFTSLNPVPSTHTFYATASATQDHAGVTSMYGDPGDWMVIRKNPTSQGGNGFVKFNLTGIDPDAIITGARLTIWQNSMQEGPLDLGIYHGNNDAWSLADLSSPIGYDPDDFLSFISLASGGWRDIHFDLDTTSENLQQDLSDQFMTLGLIPEESSNSGVYAYFEGAAAVRMRQPYLSITTLIIPCDYDKDRDADGDDLARFTTYFNDGELNADLDKNGVVDSLDLELFSQYFGGVWTGNIL